MTKKTEKREDKVKNTKTGVEKEKNRRGKKILGVFLGILIILGVGGVLGYKFSTRTKVTTEIIEIAEDEEGFSDYFKEYVANRAEVDNLFTYTFRDLTNEEILDKLSEIKEGLGKVSRGMNEVDGDSEYAEMAEIMKSDATKLLSTIRELRAVMVKEYGSDGDKQLAFMERAQMGENELRSQLYLSRAAFTKETGGLSSKGIVILQGEILAEVGGGVMNVFLGDFEDGVTGVTTDDFAETAKTIEANKMFGLVNEDLVKIGTGVKNELEIGKINIINVQIAEKKATITRMKMSLAGKATWNFKQELEEQGFLGLVKADEGTISERLTETILKLKEKKMER